MRSVEKGRWGSWNHLRRGIITDLELQPASNVTKQATATICFLLFSPLSLPGQQRKKQARFLWWTQKKSSGRKSGRGSRFQDALLLQKGSRQEVYLTLLWGGSTDISSSSALHLWDTTNCTSQGPLLQSFLVPLNTHCQASAQHWHSNQPVCLILFKIHAVFALSNSKCQRQ